MGAGLYRNVGQGSSIYKNWGAYEKRGEDKQ